MSRSRSLNEAPDRPRSLNFYRPAFDDAVQGIFQVVFRNDGPQLPEFRRAIVYGAGVQNASAVVDNEGLRRCRRFQKIREPKIGILQDREPDVVGFDESFCGFGSRLPRKNPIQLDSLRLKVPLQFI